MIQIQAFTFNPFMEQTYVLFDETKEAVIIDPGCHAPEEKEALKRFISDNNLQPIYVLNTHGHIDHVLGNSFVKETFGIPLVIGEKDEDTLRSVIAYAPAYGFQNYHASEPDRLLKTGDSVKFGNSELFHVFVPGHAPGHIAFFDKTKAFIIGGDVLFAGSIGRTDLPGGDFDTLIESIHRAFFVFPDDTVVYPGHGEPTTIGKEKATNPFCATNK